MCRGRGGGGEGVLRGDSIKCLQSNKCHLVHSIFKLVKISKKAVITRTYYIIFIQHKIIDSPLPNDTKHALIGHQTLHDCLEALKFECWIKFVIRHVIQEFKK